MPKTTAKKETAKETATAAPKETVKATAKSEPKEAKEVANYNPGHTFMAKESEIKRACYLIDAKDKVLGRLATKAAVILRGKHKAIFTPHVDCGDMVVIINADKIRVTGKKLTDKEHVRHSGYPSGKKVVALGDMLKNKPEMVLKLAINRMISRGPLGWKIRSKLKIYAGDKHPHEAQKPIVLEV